MDVLIMFLPPHIQAMIQASNGEHLVSYPPAMNYLSMNELGVVEPVHQTLGTLMGERTSFPILCFEVLAAHVSNLRRCGDVRPLERILEGVRINGDDRLCISTDDLEAEFWEFCEKFLGFKESKGKSYTHTDYANINSQSYQCNVLQGTPFKIPVRASGLEHGQKKLDEPFDPTTVITQILQGCHNSTMEWTVLQRYMARFHGEADRIAAGRNLFIHQSLGGLGQSLPCRHGKARCRRSDGQLCGHATGSNWKVCVTLEQRFVAGALLQEASGKAVPVNGPCFQQAAVFPQLFETPWDVYGKPTYWTAEEYVLKSMGDCYKAQLSRFEAIKSRDSTGPVHSLPSGTSLLMSKLRCPDGGGVTAVETVEENFRSWQCPECLLNLPMCRDCSCGWTRTAWQCSVCLIWNPELGVCCRVCSEFEHPAALVKTDSRNVHRSVTRPKVNVSLSRPKLVKLGFGEISLDEFDHSLYSHAIESARLEYEGNPTVRYCGRAVDLWGENESWAPLRSATLVWH
jgi:hypothetical protein